MTFFSGHFFEALKKESEKNVATKFEGGGP